MHSNPLQREFFQNAWVVDDLSAAIDQWVTKLGVGPFFVTEYRDVFSDVVYRGVPGLLNMKVALAQNGPIQIELIEPLRVSDKPTLELTVQVRQHGRQSASRPNRL